MDGELILALVDPRSRRVVHEFPQVGLEDLESGRFLRLGRAGESGETARRWPGSRVQLGGVAVDLMSAGQLVDTMLEALAARPAVPLLIGSVNLDHVHHFGPNAGPELRRIGLARNWLMNLDGAPVVWAARRATGRRQERLSGSDCLPLLLAAAADSGHTVGFLGGTIETQVGLRRALATDFPDLTVTGHWIPERAELESPQTCQAIVEKIAASGTDMLVVGLGKPLQELWLQKHAAQLGISVALAYGAAADFMAGVVERAPQKLRDNGLEWAYRLSIEPRRLSRRYLIQGPPALTRLFRSGRQAGPDATSQARLIVLPDTDHAARMQRGVPDELPAVPVALAADG